MSHNAHKLSNACSVEEKTGIIPNPCQLRHVLDAQKSSRTLWADLEDSEEPTGDFQLEGKTNSSQGPVEHFEDQLSYHQTDLEIARVTGVPDNPQCHDRLPSNAFNQYGQDDRFTEETVDSFGIGLASKGSSQHGKGKCVKCVFFGRRIGCKNGTACDFCHLPHNDGKQNRPNRNRRMHLKKVLRSLKENMDSDATDLFSNPEWQKHCIQQLPGFVTKNAPWKEKVVKELSSHAKMTQTSQFVPN